jgi:hypothetical protein
MTPRRTHEDARLTGEEITVIRQALATCSNLLAWARAHAGPDFRAALTDFANFFRPHRSKFSWPHQDRLRRSSGPTRPGSWQQREGLDQASCKMLWPQWSGAERSWSWPGWVRATWRSGAKNTSQTQALTQASQAAGHSRSPGGLHDDVNLAIDYLDYAPLARSTR